MYSNHADQVISVALNPSQDALSTIDATLLANVNGGWDWGTIGDGFNTARKGATEFFTCVGSAAESVSHGVNGANDIMTGNIFKGAQKIQEAVHGVGQAAGQIGHGASTTAKGAKKIWHGATH